MKNKYFLLTLLLFLGLNGFSQETRKIKGVVKDENGESIPGVNVLVFGTSSGTVTNVNGEYSLDAPTSAKSLVFSFVGYLTETIDIENRSVIDLSLRPDIVALSEVVVVGYGTQRKKDLSIAASDIGGDALNTTIQSSVGSALQGRTSGVTVATNSGAPGSGVSVRIRGAGSWNAAEPLYVVDGVVLGGLSPDYLNSADIKSVTVLKDAAATAIYGARGAHGVVLITTNTGKFLQKATIEYEGSFGIQQVSRKLDLLNAREYAILNNEGELAAGRTPRPDFANPDALGEGTDWQDAIFQTAPMQQHKLAFSGGNETTNYYISGSFFDQEGIVGGEKSAFKRYTVVANTISEFGDNVRLTTNLTLSHRDKNNLSENNIFGNPIIRAINMDPVTPVRLPNGDFAASPYQETDIKNPVNSIALNNSIYSEDRMVGKVNLAYEVIEGLTLETDFGASLQYGTSRGLTSSYQLFTIDGRAPSNEVVAINSVGTNIQKFSSYQSENLARYIKTFGDGHNGELVVGYSLFNNIGSNVGGGQNDLPTNDFEKAFLSSGRDPNASPAGGGFGRSAVTSFFGRLNYDYNKKYFFTASFRRDGSTRFGENFRYGSFPAFSAAWVLSEESFFDLPGIDFLKIRGGWGVNGSDRIGDFGYTALIDFGYNYNFGPGNPTESVGAAPSVPPNPDLKWEEVSQSNIGINIGLLKEKLDIEIDLYKKTTDDLLASLPIPLIVGAVRGPAANVGSLENRGIELGINYNTNVGELEIAFNGNVSFNRNEVLDVNANGGFISSNNIQHFGDNISRTEVGSEIGSFYGFVTDGLFQSVDEVNAHSGSEGLLQPAAQPGDIRFVDLNNDGIIDANDRQVLGSPTPNSVFGLNTNLSYKNFDFTIFLQGAAGMQVAQGIIKTDFNGANRLRSRLDRWTGPGTSNSEPRFTFSDLNRNNRFSDRFVKDADYLRVKTLQIGYTLPKTLLNKIKIDRIRVYASVQNLFTFTTYDGYDPEIGSTTQFQDQPLNTGVDLGYFPLPRIFTGGIQVRF